MQQPEQDITVSDMLASIAGPNRRTKRVRARTQEVRPCTEIPRSSSQHTTYPASKGALQNLLKDSYSGGCACSDTSDEDSTSASDSNPDDMYFNIAPDSTPFGKVEQDN